MQPRPGRSDVAALLALVFVIVAAIATLAQDPVNWRDSQFLRIDPAKILVTDSKGNKPCGECHTPEWEVWSKTKHAASFDSLNKKDRAQEIMDSLGIRSTKRDSAVCMRCHYTVGPTLKAVAGVSCESCHGPARDWINVHNKWTGGAKDAASEDPAGRAQRIAQSRSLGMLRPSADLYGVTANCYECHTVPMENLVNKGRHKAGTAGFDLVKRVNSIRHNFKGAARSGGVNRPLSQPETRVLFLIGRLLAQEYAVRGLAAATAAGTYSRSMEKQLKTATAQLDEVASVVPVPHVVEALRVSKAVRAVPGNRAELDKAAAQLRAIGERFASANLGGTLAALDPLVAGEKVVAAQPAAEPAPVAAAPEPKASAAGKAAAPAATTTPATVAAAPKANSPAPAASAPAPSAPAAKAEMPGKISSRPAWHTKAGRTGFAEPGECASCHDDADATQSEGPHSKAGKRLGENAKARQIAELYGIGAGNSKAPNNICVSCHMTTDEGSKTIVEQEVTCERCHGAASQYLDPHKKGKNPQLGMRALKQANDRAQLCADCHLISDERLLAAGHTSGGNWEIVSASNKIKHWPGDRPSKARAKRGETYTAPADGALKAAFAAIAASRPIPKVSVVAPVIASRPSAPRTPAAETPAAPAQTNAASATTTSAKNAVTSGAPAASVSAAPASAKSLEAIVASRPASAPVRAAIDTGTHPGGDVFRPARRANSSLPPRVPTTLPPRTTRATVPLDLEPLNPPANATVEELLLLIKKRVERIHAAIRG